MARSVSLTPDQRRDRARKAANVRWHGDARRDHRAATIERWIEQALTDAPPLSQAQCDRLAALLTGHVLDATGLEDAGSDGVDAG